jgi:2-oxoglutarate ferredoxin oxidoreductase subunit delta
MISGCLCQGKPIGSHRIDPGSLSGVRPNPLPEADENDMIAILTRDGIQSNMIRLVFPLLRGPNSELPIKGDCMPKPKPKLKQLVINRNWCKGCSLCVELCPKNVLELDEVEKAVAVRPQDCTCCKLCELRCPDLAIEVETESDKD